MFTPDEDNVNIVENRFRFCGNLDCPDWVLAEIVTLSKLTSVKIRLLCSQVLKGFLGDDIDFEKVQKLSSDAKFEWNDIKATVAALDFILSNSAKYDVEGDALSDELQQLGLPKEHSTALCKVYSDNVDKLRTRFLEQSLRISHLESVDWKVNYLITSSLVKDINEPSLELSLSVSKPESVKQERVTFALTEQKSRVLLHELREALSIMEGLS